MSNQENCLTLINVFPVEPQKQQQLIDILTEAAEKTMRFRPGFLSAQIYRGLSGAYVANYVQWRSQEDFDRMWQQPEAQQHVAQVHTVARGNPQLYELCSTVAGVSPHSVGKKSEPQPCPVLSAEHDILISKSWEQCFQLCSALDRWPDFMPAVRTARILRESHGDQEIELTAEFGSQILTWRSRREILPEQRTIRFWSLTPRDPIKSLSGEWFFEPADNAMTRVRVAHSFELHDPLQEAAVRAGISRNMIGDLKGMKNYMEKNL
jgi:ribosome-associated toxin RatA of RatAB toxin-antitoxin module/quinol monooxygenase YgiN